MIGCYQFPISYFHLFLILLKIPSLLLRSQLRWYSTASYLNDLAPLPLFLCLLLLFLPQFLLL